jgi:hypothetical protein
LLGHLDSAEVKKLLGDQAPNHLVELKHLGVLIGIEVDGFLAIQVT